MLNCRMATCNELAKAEAMSQHADFYSILGYKFRICSNERQLKNLFRYMYRQFLVQQPDVINNKFSFFARNGRGSLLLIDNKVYPLRKSAFLPSQLHMMVFNTIAYQVTDYFLFHAAALSKKNQGIIIVGLSGSGKTSLALKLAHEGYDFLSDELAPVHRQNLKLYPFPRSLSLRRGTLKLFPHLKNQPLLHNVNVTQDESWFMDATRLSPRNKPCSLKAIYFLDSDQGKGNFQVNMGLYKENPKFADTMNAIPGVSFMGREEKGGYPVYRFRIKMGTHSLVNFFEACRPYRKILFYREDVWENKINFNRERKFVPLDKSAAALELLKHLRNRTRRNLLRRELLSTSQLLVEMGRIVEGVECWRIEESD